MRVLNVMHHVTSRPSYVEAYRLMREGALYLIIASLIIGVGGMMLISSFFPALLTRQLRPSVIWGLLIGLVILEIIGGIIWLIGAWGKFIPGARRLGELNPEFGTASTLIYIGLFWGIILMIIGVLLLVVIVGFFIIIVAIILLILGYVGVIILGFKLHDLEKNTLYLVATILFIIGIFVPILSFIAWIILYIALGESIRKAEIAPPTPPTTPPTLPPL